MPQYEFSRDVTLKAGPRARMKFKAGSVESITTAQAREADEKGAGKTIGKESADDGKAGKRK